MAVITNSAMWLSCELILALYVVSLLFNLFVLFRRFPSSATIGDTECVNVTILDNLILESDEDFTLLLTDPVNATIGDPSDASVTIVDDDAQTIGINTLIVDVTLNSHFLILSSFNVIRLFFRNFCNIVLFA